MTLGQRARLLLAGATFWLGGAYLAVELADYAGHLRSDHRALAEALQWCAVGVFLLGLALAVRAFARATRRSSR